VRLRKPNNTSNSSAVEARLARDLEDCSDGRWRGTAKDADRFGGDYLAVFEVRAARGNPLERPAKSVHCYRPSLLEDTSMSQLVVVVGLCVVPVRAQRTLEYDHSVVTQVRIDMRDLGYPPLDVIPSDESAIWLGLLSNGSKAFTDAPLASGADRPPD